ncbi:high-affinity nitrate transporter-activating protein 2.1-like [Phragmites australis]|uniref:high-affinity nitrate transporter-activating protein 2.1-like n=1 Tax=Phragmites australis TaxID=29695 RepID=UPI002D78C7B7|nr:high-affinity nitrate transporter-activating protein 2.1-like [Phragmites australis]
MARQQAGAVAFAVLAAVLLGAGLPSPAAAGVLLSALPKALAVSASPTRGQVLHAGEDTLTVTWSLNTTEQASADAAYKNVKVTLCYAPESQKDRGWRKFNDDLSKDKACQFKVTEQAYTAGAAGKFDYRVARDIPTGSYFVRAYALDASGTQVAYGQTDAAAAFNIAGITGIHASIKVAAGVFSAFSVVSLAFFFVVENRKKNK